MRSCLPLSAGHFPPSEAQCSGTRTSQLHPTIAPKVPSTKPKRKIYDYDTTILAILGGPAGVTLPPGDTFTWPIITEEDETAVLEVLRRGAMSELDVTMAFEKDFAAWQGRTYALGFNTGTSALHAAMFGVGLGVGDEIICPSITYWASALQCFSLGATVVFADVRPDTLCLDPNDIEQRISPRTKAIMVVHYLGHPADMDAIMQVADRHGIPVIEDVSHAHGGRYRGRTVGNFGAVAAMSLMSGKSMPIGEGGHARDRRSRHL